MSDYRRNYQQGGTYFFTVTLRNRKSSLLVHKFHELQTAVNRVKQSKPFKINAWVVLPDHLHLIWNLIEGDSDYSGKIRSIKTLFCKQLGPHRKYSTKIWQPRFWEHTIRSENDLHNHINYIHINPLKHRLVTKVVDWPYSSFHHYLKRGVYSKNWGVDIEITDADGFGE